MLLLPCSGVFANFKPFSAHLTLDRPSPSVSLSCLVIVSGVGEGDRWVLVPRIPTGNSLDEWRFEMANLKD